MWHGNLSRLWSNAATPNSPNSPASTPPILLHKRKSHCFWPAPKPMTPSRRVTMPWRRWMSCSSSTPRMARRRAAAQQDPRLLSRRDHQFPGHDVRPHQSRRIPHGQQAANEEGRFDDETQHKVKITKPFMLGIFPVTQKQWVELMDNNPSTFKGDNLPVEAVTWDDAAAFSRKLVLPWKGSDSRLPTEGEWRIRLPGRHNDAIQCGGQRKRLSVTCWMVTRGTARTQDSSRGPKEG